MSSRLVREVFFVNSDNKEMQYRLLIIKRLHVINTDIQQLLIKLATYCIKAHDVRNQNNV